MLNLGLLASRGGAESDWAKDGAKKSTGAALAAGLLPEVVDGVESGCGPEGVEGGIIGKLIIISVSV